MANINRLDTFWAYQTLPIVWSTRGNLSVEKLISINSAWIIQLRKVLTVCNLDPNVRENMDPVNLTLCKAQLRHIESENWKRDPLWANFQYHQTIFFLDIDVEELNSSQIVDNILNTHCINFFKILCKNLGKTNAREMCKRCIINSFGWMQLHHLLIKMYHTFSTVH